MGTDTHSLIWYLEDSPRLSRNARQVFEACDRNELAILVPTICLVEMLYLQEKVLYLDIADKCIWSCSRLVGLEDSWTFPDRPKKYSLQRVSELVPWSLRQADGQFGSFTCLQAAVHLGLALSHLLSKQSPPAATVAPETGVTLAASRYGR